MDIPRELARLIRKSPNLRDLLDRAVDLVARRMGVDVCSIYVLDPADRRLWLVASHGFRPEALGAASLAPGEGLTGRVVSLLRPLAVPDARLVEGFRYFPETGEDDFHSYLGEPLALGGRRVGAIVLRTRERREYRAEERETLSAIASQLVGLVENVRLMEALARPQDTGLAYWRELGDWHAATPEGPPRARPGETLQGTPISAGIVIAEAVVVAAADTPVPRGGGGAPEEEGANLDRALERVRTELAKVQEFSRSEAGELSALIFQSHLLILSDPSLLEKLRARIASGASAAVAVDAAFGETATLLEQVTDAYLRERVSDVRELRRRLLAALAGSAGEVLTVEGRIAVVAELTAALVVELRARGALGIVATHGGPTSHGALLARSFGLPSVAGVPDAHRILATGERLALDGEEGTVVVRPDEEVERVYRHAIEVEARHRAELESLRELEARTRDGHLVPLLANVGLTADLRLAARSGAAGVGLFRTELPFLLRETIPSRSEQVAIYRRAFEELPGLPIVFRTLDLGGDKYRGVRQEREANPFLGYRSIRISLDHPDDFVRQVQAFMIASHGRDGRIMLPLVSRLEEVEGARGLVARASDALRAEGLAHHESMPLGVMIEVPAAVELAPALAREVSFFSIGTNDLVQYALAVDRGNERVAHLGDPWHPAVLSMIHRTTLAAHEAGIEVCVCGEMAGDPDSALLLLGLGVDSLSMNGGSIPAVKKEVRGTSLAVLRRKARELLSASRAEEVRSAWTSTR